MARFNLSTNAVSPPTPAPGFASIYFKTDNVLYIKDSSGVETAIGTASGITQLHGDVTALGPGDVAATVVFVGGKTAAEIAQSVTDTQAATSANTVNVIVKRDSNGDIFVTHINGVVVEAHAARHLPNGADPLTTAAPLVDLSATTTNATGTANSLARSDHSHAIDTATAVSLNTTSTNTAGTAATLARSDHTHNIASAPPVTQNPDQSNAPGSSVGFAKADHIHNIPTAAPSADLNATTSNGQGTSTSFSRADHSHAIDTAIAVTQNADQSNAIGTAAGLSRADHIHNIPTDLPVTQNADISNTQGVSVKFAKSDHVHNIPTDVPVTQNVDQTNTQGTSTKFAKADHVHNIPTDIAVQIGTSNNQGASTKFSRADHVHAHGAQTDPTLHALVTTSANGFMSAADKVKLNTISATTGTDGQILIANNVGVFVPQTMSGDVVNNDTGVTTIQANVVSNSKLAQMAANTVKANTTGSTANASDVALGTVTETGSSILTLTGWADATIGSPTVKVNLTSSHIYVGSASNIATDVAMSGDVNISNTGATTIQANVVSNSKLAQMPANTLKGNNTVSTANALDLTVAQVNTMLGTVTTVGTFDSQVGVANGATIIPNSIYFQSATLTVPGMVNTGIQTFGGNKSFRGIVNIQPQSDTKILGLQHFSATPASSSDMLTLYNSTGSVLGLIDYVANFQSGDGNAVTPGHSFRNNTGMGMYRANSDTLAFSTVSSERMRITSTGHILINTSTDDGTHNLQVNGSSQLTGTVSVTSSSTAAVAVNSTDFVVDGTNHTVGIGTLPANTTVFDIVNNTGAIRAIQSTAYGFATPNRGRYANGTLASPTAATTGNSLHSFSARGYGATAFAAASTGVMNIVAGATFTDTSMPTYIAFSTTPTASVTSAERMRINSTGNILVNTTTDNATDLLQLSGGALSTYYKLAGSTSGTFNQQAAATTASYSIVWPSAQGVAGTVPFNDGAGNLTWSNPTLNIDGGRPDSVYTASQFINGGTP